MQYLKMATLANNGVFIKCFWPSYLDPTLVMNWEYLFLVYWCLDFVVLSSQIAETYIKEVSFPPPKPEQKNQFGRPLIPSKPQNDVRVETICSSKMNFAPIDIIPSSCSGDL